jgi:hypothetical protein
MTVLEGKVEGQPPSAEDREEVRRRIRECGELFNPADVRDFTNDDIFFDRYIYIHILSPCIISDMDICEIGDRRTWAQDSQGDNVRLEIRCESDRG